MGPGVMVTVFSATGVVVIMSVRVEVDAVTVSRVT